MHETTTTIIVKEAILSKALRQKVTGGNYRQNKKVSEGSNLSSCTSWNHFFAHWRSLLLAGENHTSKS
jgi:hypothetical protein